MKNYSVRIVFAFALASFQSATTLAASVNLSSDPALRVMPIVGYETIFRDSPTPHTSSRLIYGLRVSYGIPALSGEAEYTRGNDVENYTTAPERIRNEDENLKLGLVSSYHPAEFFFVSARAGGQASQGKREVTSSGVVTTTTKDLEVNPYAGAGLGFHLSTLLTLSANTTVVFRDYKNMRENDVQSTVSLSVGIN